jgi:hypothetical protein
MRHLLLIMIISAGHTLVVPAQTDFRISEENVPSTFRQSNPKLFSAHSNGFIVAWEDARDGDPGHYAQRFDNNGNPAGANFRIDSHYDMMVTEENSFFVLRPYNVSYFFPPYDEINIFSLYGRIYKNQNPVTDPFLMMWQEVPWCGTGVLPRNHSLAYGAGYHLFAINWGMHLRKYDTGGNLVHIESERYGERFHIGEVSVAVTDGGHYMLTWFSADQWETTPGVYATFFDAQDSVIADSVGIFSYEGYDEWYWFNMNDPMVHAETIADTAYQIFVIRRDSLTIQYRQFDASGKSLGDTDTINIPLPETGYGLEYSDMEARFSRGMNGEIILFIGSSIGPYNDRSHTSSIIIFNPDGSFTGNIDTIDGALAGEEIILDSKAVLFYHDGTMIAPWRKSLSSTSTGVGYTLYDLNREILLSDTIAITTKTFDNYLRIASVILDDGTCVIAYTTPGDLRIRQITSDGTILKEIAVTPVNYVFTLKIFKESDGMFWVNWVTYAQQFNSELEPAGDIVDSKTLWDIYIGNRTVLNYRRDYFNNYYGTFVNVTGDTLLADVKIAHNASEFTAWSLPDTRFLVVFQSGGKLYTRAYSHQGIALGDSIMIHQNVGDTKKNPAVSIIDNRVFFAWADIRPPGYGYDIYGRVMKLSDIITSVEYVDTAVPASYALYQNYPNPFNPATSIQYSIPQAEFVTLKIYDILGKEVKTLVHEYRQPGIYRVSFEGGNLSSGVYLYKVTAGPFTNVKRMILVR